MRLSCSLLHASNVFLCSFLSAVSVTATTIKQDTDHPSAKNTTNATMNQFSFFNNPQDAKTQRILEDQRRRQQHQAILLLQHQQEMDHTFSEMAGPGTMRTQFGNQLLHGANPIDIECRNIIALQEELRRQENKRRAEEVLHAKMQEQALLMELQKQATMQQTAAEQLLSQFVELDQLVIRQELLQYGQHQGQGGGGGGNSASAFNLDNLRSGSGHGNSNSNNFTSQELINYMRCQGQNQNQSFGALQGLDQFHGHPNLQSPLNETSSFLSSLSHANPIPSGLLSSMQPRKNLSAGMLHHPNFQGGDSRGLSSNLERQIADAHAVLSVTAPRSADTLHDLPRKIPGAPAIRYFNNGNEVNHNGTTNPVQIESKKRKVRREEVISIDCDTPDIPKKKVCAQVTVKIEHHAAPPQKGALKLRKYWSSQAKEESEKVISARAAPGPHADLIGSMFPHKKTKKVKVEATCNDKEEDKLDAANALLGFMKNV